MKLIGILCLFSLIQCSAPVQSPIENLADYYLPGEDDVNKLIIYQVLPRLFGNTNTGRTIYGTLAENGVGKFSDFTDLVLDSLKSLGITHIWYTGIIEHAQLSDYREYGIAPDDADVVKGRAGSPYAIKDYYDVDPDLASEILNRMNEFESLVERTHLHGLKVIIDFVPNHVARQYHSDAKPAGIRDLGENDNPSVAFSPMNNFYYLPGKEFKVPEGYVPLGNKPVPSRDGKFKEMPAKATGNNVFSNQPGINDWFETVKLNYGIDFNDQEKKYFNPIPSTWYKMRDILLFWGGKNVDGFRCDMAEMVPVEFWGWVIPQIKEKYRNIKFIAEIYNPSKYREYIDSARFDYLYDKVQLYDTLRQIVQGKGSAESISRIWQDLRGLNSHMVRFLENHDEQRIASPFFAGDPVKAKPAMTVISTLYNGPVMIYCGQEVGEPGNGAPGFSGDDGRTTIYDYWSMPEFVKWFNGGKCDGKELNKDQKKLREFYRRLLTLTGNEKPFTNGAFFDLAKWNRSDSGSTIPVNDVYCYLRIANGQTLLVIVNFNASKDYDLEFRIPGEIDKKNIFHESVKSERTDLLGNNKLFHLSGKNGYYTGHVRIENSESLIFNL